MPRLQKTWILPTLYFRALEGPLKFGFFTCLCVFFCVFILSMQRAAACAVVGLVASANLLFPFPYKATFFSPLLSLVY
ncbi:hypothetical protein BDR26DRAFT_859074 [Obelidium mucronatum]|nr:hypothetical protein BDR26DRAFT_859074 [Obelidium mucronatum]